MVYMCIHPYAQKHMSKTSNKHIEYFFELGRHTARENWVNELDDHTKRSQSKNKNKLSIYEQNTRKKIAAQYENHSYNTYKCS